MSRNEEDTSPGGLPPQRDSDVADQGVRLTRLARAVDGPRKRRARAGTRAMQMVGALSMSFGIMAIVFGWYGTAHSPYLFQEVPYLISGGLLGVALTAVGGFLFLSAWVVRLIDAVSAGQARVRDTGAPPASSGRPRGPSEGLREPEQARSA